MSVGPSDPFDLLRQVPLREPVAARLEADARLARAEYLAAPGPRRRGWLATAVLQDWRPRVFLPLGAGLAAVLGLWLAWPGLGPGGPMLADAEVQNPGTRLGAQPGPVVAEPGGTGISARYGFDGFELLLREPPGQLVLSLAQGGQDRPFASFVAEDGVDFRVLDAIIQPRPGQDPLLLVRAVYGGFTNWNAYEMGAGAITLSGRLSLLIHDAPDRAALIARLAPDSAP